MSTKRGSPLENCGAPLFVLSTDILVDNLRLTAFFTKFALLQLTSFISKLGQVVQAYRYKIPTCSSEVSHRRFSTPPSLGLVQQE